MTKRPLKQRLILDGLCATVREAEAVVLSGEALVNGVPARPGQPVADDADVRLKGKLPYAGKGGLKLAGALKTFQLNVAGKVCVDAGASTGGFTDCLLQHGAARVYAVDVGFGQLTGALRQDARVVNLERTNVSDEKLLTLSPAPAFASVDLSYLSLRDAIPAFRAILRGAGEAATLVKPLFEIADAKARRTGIIPDSAYEPTLRDLIAALNAQPGTRVINVCASPVRGNGGTLEFFLHIVFSDSRCAEKPPDLDGSVRNSVFSALRGERLGKGDLT